MRYANAAYYVPKRDSSEVPSTINVDAITHIYYAAAQTNSDGTVHLRDHEYNVETIVDGNDGCIKACQLLKARNHRLKILLSVSLDFGAKQFPKSFELGYVQEKFVETASALVDTYQFDGLDVDWEHPTSAKEGRILCGLLQKLRARMPPPNLQLTAVLPAVEDDLQQIDVQKASRQVDYLNLLSYDFFGSWSQNCGHQAQLNSPRVPYMVYNSPRCSHAAVSYLVKKGVHSQRILLGIPTHGRRFSKVTQIGQEYKRVNQDVRKVPYRELPRSVEAEVDHDAVAAYKVERTEDGVSLISYDNKFTVATKASYVMIRDLGGMYFSNISDDKKGNEGLVNVGYDILSGGAN